MISFFERLPALVMRAASWAIGNPMTCILITVFLLASAFILLTASYQHQTRRNDLRSRDTEHRSKPGSFPGDNR